MNTTAIRFLPALLATAPLTYAQTADLPIAPLPPADAPFAQSLRELIADKPLESLVLVLAVFGALTALLIALLIVKSRRARHVDRLLYSDDLTRLLNFRKFRIEASLLLNAPKRPAYTMIYLNVNDFKFINDTFGYAAGDGVLRALSGLIGRRMAPDELVARLQGDRFVALLRRETRADVENRVSAIFHDVDAFNEQSDLTCNVTVSLGAYDVPDGENDVNAAIDRANYARSQVTQRHANERIFYSDAFRNRIRREKEMERVMNDALAAGQFRVYYQPKVDCTENRLAGAEALVRWLHPERGLIPPSEFIPLFEKNGFIVKVDLFVFEEVCKWLKARMDAKLPTCVISSNFSRLHLADDDFPEHLCRIADRYGVPHALLEVEITETVAVGYGEQVKKHLERLHALGFRPGR